MALLMGVGGLRAAHATHIIGGDIAYAPVASTTAGVPRYHVTVRLFRDAVSAVQQDMIDLTCNRGGCNATAADYFTVTIRRGQVVPYAAPNCPLLSSSRVYDINFFETDVDLPRGQWTLSVHTENRSSVIRNITNSVNQTLYLSAFLDNALVAQNNSPRFETNLLPYICGNSAQRYSFSTFNIDGDSLVYSFTTSQSSVQPLNLCGVDVGNFIPGQFQLNAATGALTAPAGNVQQGLYIMAARVNEYRRLNGTWQPIGYVMRDVTYVAYTSVNSPPMFTGFTLGNGAPQSPSQVVPVQAVSLTLSAADPDAGQSLRFSTDATAVVPGLSLITLGATQARLTWQVPATLPPGRYTATVAVFDNGCPLNASEEQTFSFLVSAPGTALADHPALPPANGAAFPMPFREQVQFQAAAGGQAVTIVDELGRVVARLQAGADGRVQWQPTPTLPAGLYVARGADGRPLARLLRAGY
ncbi:hypothetical protein A0257_17365 [Hymenobacter psoromatis]|nr:hypothetical protein A0257_17365 [Hymenobacter psoromatis]